MAPEFLENKNVHFTEKTEVYSFGVLLWEIFSDPKLAREGPYPNLQPVQILFQVLNNGLRPKVITSTTAGACEPVNETRTEKPTTHSLQLSQLLSPNTHAMSNGAH